MGVFSFLSKYFISIPAMVVLPVPPLPASATEYGIFVKSLSFEFPSGIDQVEYFKIIKPV
jgi:hypothetical protein